MEILKDVGEQVLKRIPEKYRLPLLLMVLGALVSTWALAKLDDRVHAIIKPMKENHDVEIRSIKEQLTSIDNKLDIVLDKL